MALEHRWSQRKQVRLNALVLHRLAGLLQTHILNIGLERAYIAVEYPALPVQAIVHLSFVLEIAGTHTINQTDAFVIHRSHGGYGLMFKEFRFTAFPALKSPFYAA